MRILFISDNFPPEVNAPANRTYEHCCQWVKQGEDVCVITCAPNFPEGKLIQGYKNKLYQEETQQGILVKRVWSYITANKGTIKRSLDYLSFAFSATLAGIFSKADLVIATSPQFFSACAGFLIARIKRVPWVFEVRDLWPESIRAVGAVKNEKVFRILEAIELFLYKSADLIVVVTDAFKKHLISRGIEDKKIVVIKNGVNQEHFSPRAKDKELISNLGLAGKKIILYAGTLGMAHGLEFILRAAKRLEHKDEFYFLIIGTGAEGENLKRLCTELNPANLKILDPVSRDLMPKYLSIADFALVNLRRSDTFKAVLPSKIFENAAMGIPILLGVEGEAKELVSRYNAGLSFTPEDFGSFNTVLDRLADETTVNDLRKGALSLAADFDRNKLAKTMLSSLRQIV